MGAFRAGRIDMLMKSGRFDPEYQPEYKPTLKRWVAWTRYIISSAMILLGGIWILYLGGDPVPHADDIPTVVMLYAFALMLLCWGVYFLVRTARHRSGNLEFEWFFSDKEYAWACSFLFIISMIVTIVALFAHQLRYA